MTQRLTRDEWIAFAIRNVDDNDLQWLQQKLDDSGHGRFWQLVVHEWRGAVAYGENTQTPEEG